MSRAQRERTVILAVAPNPRPVLQASFVLRHKNRPHLSELIVLADAGLSVIARYGLRIPSLTDDRKYPYPATFLIDESGVVRWKAFGITTPAFSERKALEILARLVPDFELKSRPYIAAGGEKDERRP
jgi:peroxiredoxin